MTFWDFAQFFVSGVALLLVIELLRFGIDTLRSSQQTAEKEFQVALDSTDLSVLSSYLKCKLGGLSVQDYVGKATARERVDLYLARLTDFVGANEPTPGVGDDSLQEGEAPPQGTETPAEPSEADLPPPEPSRVNRREDDPAILKEAREMVESGSIWTALATLRRDLEQRLQPLATGRVLQPADVSQKFGVDAARHFERFQRVANRAVHGEDVHLESARAAINSARALYEAIEQEASA